jgi:cell division protein FtsB
MKRNFDLEDSRTALVNLVSNRTTVLVIGSVLVGTFMLAPSLQVYLTQLREIQLAEQAIEQAKRDIVEMEKERDRWRDPGYIKSQARDRLYYVMPGEVSFLVMNAESVELDTVTVGEVLAAKRNASSVSGNVSAADANWIHSVVESVLRSSLEKPPADTESD